MIRIAKSSLLMTLCGGLLSSLAAGAMAGDFVAWSTVTGPTEATLSIGYGASESEACACLQRVSGATGCNSMSVPYTVPACPHPDPATPGAPVTPTVEYKVEFKAAGNPFGTVFHARMPKDAAGSSYYSEVFVPLTLRLVALDVAKKFNWGEITTFTMTEIVDDPAADPIPGGPGGPGGTTSRLPNR